MFSQTSCTELDISNLNFWYLDNVSDGGKDGSGYIFDNCQKLVHIYVGKADLDYTGAAFTGTGMFNNCNMLVEIIIICFLNIFKFFFV